ncbi:tail fiber assembly protein [Ewingella americana]|uniref:Caudovirales tail fibre assembly protein n=1 Tax=Ewingella americana TaxID=41202 RepID=A0A377N9X0_9GAMM|nr:tail fiber assembly protein [Ewingella americana]KAA8727594.1 tail fiber assembly protein [Ewingella americana]STQ42877.1 Caudovirales tail fibre assembly protein [Ewingella americana]
MFELSAEDRVIKVFNFSPLTNELVGPADAWVVANTGLPAHCTMEKPPVVKANQVAVYTESGWKALEDLRGVVVYDKATGEGTRIDALGPIPDSKTHLMPLSKFDVWNGKKWVKDKEAEKNTLINQAFQDRKERMAMAAENINILTFAKESEQATKEELMLLIAWQNYRLQLSRVDVSKAPDVAWPGEPANVA